MNMFFYVLTDMLYTALLIHFGSAEQIARHFEGHELTLVLLSIAAWRLFIGPALYCQLTGTFNISYTTLGRMNVSEDFISLFNSSIKHCDCYLINYPLHLNTELHKLVNEYKILLFGNPYFMDPNQLYSSTGSGLLNIDYLKNMTDFEWEAVAYALSPGFWETICSWFLSPSTADFIDMFMMFPF